VLVSDNGASGEGGPNGSVNENKFFNNILDSRGTCSTSTNSDRRRRTTTTRMVGPGRLTRRSRCGSAPTSKVASRTPDHLVARGNSRKGELRRQFMHATDAVPTIYDLLGVELPIEVKGYQQIPLEGVSFRSTFEDADAPTSKESAFFSMLGSRGIWHKGWKAVSVHPTIAGWGQFNQDRWELYNTMRTRPRCATCPPRTR
jgi:arylsulfatase A-like enzyme